MNAQFTFHPERCVGCGACVMACINEKRINTDEQQPFRALCCNEYVDGDTVDVTYFVQGCMHCKEHPCAQVCPKGCFTYDRMNGVVVLDNSDCIGCHRCEKVCAYQAIQFTKGDKAIKCDGCIRNLKRDRLPLCVLACQRKALTIDEKNQIVTQGLEALKREIAEYNRRAEGRKSAYGRNAGGKAESGKTEGGKRKNRRRKGEGSYSPKGR